MAKLIGLDVVDLPDLVAVGRALCAPMEAMMGDSNPIPAFWDRCFADGTFAALEAAAEGQWDPSYVGLMADFRSREGKFTYLCGILYRQGVALPAGFEVLPVPAGRAALGWVRGRDTADVCGAAHALVTQGLQAAGHTCEHMAWTMELYNCPRFTTPDEDGCITLDYYIPLDA